mmetsp:Transcript_121418/g.388265  ORF Transcript_121418/g.388265 Transcript_121418/m.388265 type:complete len:214 (-) Transcript_121418:1193-1834(-)
MLAAAADTQTARWLPGSHQAPHYCPTAVSVRARTLPPKEPMPRPMPLPPSAPDGPPAPKAPPKPKLEVPKPPAAEDGPVGGANSGMGPERGCRSAKPPFRLMPPEAPEAESGWLLKPPKLGRPPRPLSAPRAPRPPRLLPAAPGICSGTGAAVAGAAAVAAVAETAGGQVTGGGSGGSAAAVDEAGAEPPGFGPATDAIEVPMPATPVVGARP